MLIRFSSIGDIVLTTPVIRCVRQQTGAELHFLTRNAFTPLLAPNPHIEKVWVLENEGNELVERLSAEKFDLIIDLHKNLRSLKLRLQLGRPSVSFDKLNIQKWLFVQFKWPALPQKHLVDRYFEALNQKGISYDGAGLDFFIDDEANCAGRKAIQALAGNPFLVCVLGAAHGTKQIPEEILMSVLAGLEIPVVLIGGKSEAGLAERILNKLSEKRIISLAGAISLGASAFVIQKGKVVLTPDTGMMHIAAALKKPTIVLWGNTVPGFGMYPLYPIGEDNSISFEVSSLHCRPCSKIGSATCPRGHFHCMRLHNEATIIATIQSFFE